jgi:hypothetical protein
MVIPPFNFTPDPRRPNTLRELYCEALQRPEVLEKISAAMAAAEWELGHKVLTWDAVRKVVEDHIGLEALAPFIRGSNNYVRSCKLRNLYVRRVAPPGPRITPLANAGGVMVGRRY